MALGIKISWREVCRWRELGAGLRDLIEGGVLVTGASGFVGRRVCSAAKVGGLRVIAAVRDSAAEIPDINTIKVGEIDGGTDWTTALAGVDVVIHLAARAHVMQEHVQDPLSAYRKINLDGTANLARQAARAGVKRLVYVSSIKVNGEQTESGCSFSEMDMPNPQDAYGITKWEAEQALHSIALTADIETVILRPPLVYGPEVRGNFERMLRMLGRGFPLPLASVHNLRSLVYVHNLVDAILVCATHPDAAEQTYIVSDGEDISTPDLLRYLGCAMKRPARLFPFPEDFLKLAGNLTGKSGQVDRLLGSLRVDSGKIRRELNWTPPYTLQQGLRATAEWYRNTHP